MLLWREGWERSRSCVNTAVSNRNNLALLTVAPVPGAFTQEAFLLGPATAVRKRRVLSAVLQHHALGREWAGGCEKQPSLCVQAYCPPPLALSSPPEVRAAEGGAGQACSPGCFLACWLLPLTLYISLFDSEISPLISALDNSTSAYGTILSTC